MKSILAVTVALFALTWAAAATAAVAPPNQGLVCGSEGCGSGGGAAVGCATVVDSAEDGANDTVSAVYHWCWNWGTITEGSGYCDYSASFGMDFRGWSQNNERWYGWDCVGHFNFVWEPWGGNSVHRCLGVDGWGNAWVCRAWYE